MDNNLFRKSSLEKFSSPEQLNDYIKVANPSTFIIITALVLVLICSLIWGITGSIANTFNLTGLIISPNKDNSQNGNAVFYIPMEQADNIKENMKVQVSPRNMPREEYGYMYGTIKYIEDIPVYSQDEMNTYNNMPWVIKDILPQDYSKKAYIEFEYNLDNELKWSNNKVQSLNLSMDNNICDLSIIVNEMKPVDLLFN